MSEQFYRIDYGAVPPQERPGMRHRVKNLSVLVPVEAQECRLSRSEPIVIGSGELAYKIELVSDQPADSLTMHGKVWLLGDTDE